MHEGHVFHQYTIGTDRRDDLKAYLAERQVVAGFFTRSQFIGSQPISSTLTKARSI